MTIEEIQARLYHHANLPSDSAPDDSLGFLLWNSARGAKPTDPSDLATSFRDVFGCLTELNNVWNGPIPSKTTRAKAISHLDRWIVYSVNVIVTCAAEYALHCAFKSNMPTADIRAATQLAFALSCTWECVLAGDIDDLRETVWLELEAKSPGASIALF